MTELSLNNYYTIFIRKNTRLFDPGVQVNSCIPLDWKKYKKDVK